MSNQVRLWGPAHGAIGKELKRLIHSSSRVWLLSPFVTTDGVEEFVDLISDEQDVRLVTRLNDRDVLSGVLDPEALAKLQDAEAKIRLHDDSLHAKLWIFDDRTVIGSANLTGKALSSNVELMVKSGAMVRSLANEFREVWRALRNTRMTSNQLRALAKRLEDHPARRRFEQAAARNGLRDYGGSKAPPPSKLTKDSGFWLKINGLSSAPIGMDTDLRSEYYMEGGQTFRKPGRPSLKEGDAVILCRIGKRNGHPDRCIYGRGIVDEAHRPAIDVIPGWLQSAIGDEEYESEQISRWPSIVWLRDLQMVDGTGAQCPWLSQINRGQSVVKLSSLSQQSHIQIDEGQAAALNKALDRAFSSVGYRRFERPEEVWWNKYIVDMRKAVTRTRLESSSQRRN